MTDPRSPAFCGQCGSPVQPGDRFCGECGAAILAPPPQAEQVLPEPVAAAQGARVRSNRRALFLAGTVGALLVLLVGGGAVALLSSGGEERSSPSEDQPQGAVGVPEEPKEVTTSVSAPPLEVTTAPEPTTGSPGPTTSEPTTAVPDEPGPEGFEAQAEEAAGDYYRAAGREDWDYTYEHLDSATQRRFTREEWFKKNQWFADNGEVIYHIESVERLGTSSGIVVGVTVRLTYEDGSTSSRDTYFVHEEGEWKHAFGKEERDLFMPDLSYKEFVEAKE